MSFTQAIQSAFANFFTLSGRAPRSEYWYFILFCLLGSLALGVIDGVVFGASLGLAPLSLIFSLVTLVPSIAVAFRRIHDVDKSGWWLLIGLVPFVGWLVLLYFFVQKGTDGDNRFGADPLGGSAPSSDFGISPAE